MFRSLSQLLFPNLCVCCAGYLSHQEGKVCDFCLYTLPKYESLGIKDCSLAKKFWGRLRLENIEAIYKLSSNNDVHKILHQIKYKGNRALGEEMGEIMAHHLSKLSYYKNIDYIIPLPLHPKRQNMRGYNQCDLLAMGMCRTNKGVVKSDLVIRKKYNSTQTKKKRYERFINSTELFKVTNPKTLEYKHVLLIDDVITTGATMEACGLALLEIEGLRLSVASLAVAT